MPSDQLFSHGYPKGKYVLRGLLIGSVLGFLLAIFAIKVSGYSACRTGSDEPTGEQSSSLAQQGQAQVGEDENAGQTEDIRVTYVVKEGDTLSKIAAAHATTTKSIMILNNLDDADTIYVGQELVVKDELPVYYYAIVSDDVVRLATNKIDGSGEEILMSAKVFASDPVVALSPDRQKLLYTEDTISGGSGALTYITDIDGTNRQEMVSSDLSLPADLGQSWSPDSQKIAYSFGKNLWIYDIQSSQSTLVSDNLVALASGLPGYAWDSKGNKIVFVNTDQDIEVFEYPSGHKSLLTEMDPGNVRQIVWPFGNIVYLLLDPGSGFELFRFSILAPVLEQVTDNELDEENMVFLRDSDQFVFAVNQVETASRQGERGIWHVDSDGQQKQLYASEDAMCRPLMFDRAGDNVFFASAERVYMVNIASMSLTLIQQGGNIIFLGDQI